MREIKFRGLNKEGKWVYGSLLQSEINTNGKCECEIHERFAHDFSISQHSVIPESVGVWMGLRDDNSVEIYEGDIVMFIDGTQLAAEWNDDLCQFQFSDGLPINDGDTYSAYKIVIGNIHQNPELI